MNRLSFDWSVLSVELRTSRCHLAAPKKHAETRSAQLTELKRMKEEAEQRTVDVHYKLDGARAKTSQFKGRKSCVQEGADRISRQSGRLKGAINRIRDQFVEDLQLDMHNSIRTAFVVQ